MNVDENWCPEQAGIPQKVRSFSHTKLSFIRQIVFFLSLKDYNENPPI